MHLPSRSANHRAGRIPFFLLVAAITGAGCSSSTGPGGNSSGNLTVEARNYGTVPRSMGLQGGSLTAVAPNAIANLQVTDPGMGNSLTFVAVAGSDTLSATCTVSSATGVSEPPQVVVQPAYNVLECVSW